MTRTEVAEASGFARAGRSADLIGVYFTQVGGRFKLGATAVSKNLQIGLVVAALFIGAAMVGAVLLQTTFVLWQIAAMSDLVDESLDAHDTAVDQYVDAGYEETVLRADDPMLMNRKILIGHNINARTAKDVATRLFYLDSVDPQRPIDLYISTQGGWSDNAFSIIDAMRLIDAPVNTWAVGGCYSAGALILASGTGRRIATDNAVVMIHANLGASSEEFALTPLMRARYENVFKQTAELPEAWYPMTKGKRYYLNGEEAKKYDLVDEVAETWPADDAGK